MTEEVTEMEGGAEAALEGDAAEQQDAEGESKDLYQAELERFRASWKTSLDGALDRYGMTMIHSITPEEYITLRQQLNVKNEKPQDLYNLGTVAAGLEEYEEAVKNFEACLKMDKTFAPALFNLGVVFEKQGQIDRAKGCFEKYCEVLAGLEEHEHFNVPSAEERATEIEQINAQLGQLAGE